MKCCKDMKKTGIIYYSIIMGLAAGSVIASLVMQILGKKNVSLFLGQWPPTLLIMGIIGKMMHYEKHVCR